MFIVFIMHSIWACTCIITNNYYFEYPSVSSVMLNGNCTIVNIEKKIQYMNVVRIRIVDKVISSDGHSLCFVKIMQLKAKLRNIQFFG